MGIASELIYGAEIPVPRRGSTAELNAIYMLSPEKGWAVGSAGPSAGARDQEGNGQEDRELGALFLHFVDGRWSRRRTPILGELTSIAMASAADGWAVGSSVSTCEQGRATGHGGYYPTTLPVLLQYRQGAWSVVAS
jgi:hypothetical protein